MKKSLWILALTLVGCGGAPSLEDMIAPHRSQAEVKLQFLDVIGKELPKLTTPKEEKLEKADGEPPDFYDRSYGNGFILAEENFADLAKPVEQEFSPENAFDEDGSYFLTTAASLVRNGTLTDGVPPSMPDMYESYLDDLLRMEYVLVARTVEYKAPKVLNDKYFSPGYHVGE